MSSRRGRNLPKFVEPMLAVNGQAPEDDRWAVEVKFDGMRAQVRWDGRRLCLRSRPGRDCTEEFPELAGMPELLNSPVILDGELVCFGDDGRPDFERLRGRLRATPDRADRRAAEAPATFLAFDVLYAGGPMLAASYAERRQTLAALKFDGPSWKTTGYWVGSADAVIRATQDQGLEGVVAKRLDGAYEPGRRSQAWIKQKHRRRERFLITGWAPSRPGQMESFSLARRRGTDLEPAGSASYGLDEGTREQLRAALEAAALPARRRNQRVRWVEPRVTAVVDFHGPLIGPVRDAIIRSVEMDT